MARMAENPSSGQIGRKHFVNEYKANSVELTGFEPVTSSLRKMRSNRRTRGNGACGGSVERLWDKRRETR